MMPESRPVQVDESRPSALIPALVAAVASCTVVVLLLVKMFAS